MAFQDNYILRVDCKCEDGTHVCYENEEGVTDYIIPNECTEIVYCKEGSSKTYSANLVDMMIGTDVNISAADKVLIAELKGEGNKEITFSRAENPIVMKYTDITEHEMFGFPEISRNVLTSSDNGLWSYHGLRKLKFNFENLQMEGEEWEISANLVLDHRENDEMLAISSEENDILQNKNYSSASKMGYEFFVFLDTNKLGDKFDNNFAKKQKMLFSGYIQIKFHYTESCDENDITYVFPVEFMVNNTNYPECRKIQKNVVSIDFGTSSSCVAVRGEDGVELITLSAAEENKNINIYENPTCVMIYRWKDIYEQWKKENEDLPVILRGNLDEYKLNQKSVQFDFGYSVKKHLREVNDQQLNSIMTEIKMIPKFLDEGSQISVRPLVYQDKKVVNLVDAYEKQDDEKLDIIAFYGYILGKAINRVEKNKIYTKFQITYPVKFSSVVRDKVRASLEYGLKRSLPKPLRTAKNEKGKSVFRVDMKYPEPVAYIGSVCGKYLTYDVENPQEQMFGVFDFGGGTLDYSFGVFGPDEMDPNSSNIYVLGVDGDSEVGGELLIKKMSYWLYTSQENMSMFVENRIPFEKPTGEVLPNGCPEELFDSTANAKSNVRKLSERFTRDIFQGIGISVNSEEMVAVQGTGGVLMPKQKKTSTINDSNQTEKDTTKKSSTRAVVNKDRSGQVVLYDVDGNEVEIQVTVDENALIEKLTEVLHRKVEDFKNSMRRTFESHKDLLDQCKIVYNEKDVHIFEAGNSSRNYILQEEMNTAFSDMTHEIMLIDETDDDFMTKVAKSTTGAKPNKIALTPKTAVAFGQVILSDYFVDDSFIYQGTGDAPFNWYIGTINRGNNVFTMLIDKANVNKEWKLYGRINSVEMQIYYAETPVDNADDSKLRSVKVDSLDEDDKQKMLYVRVQGSDSVQCCVCDRSQKPEDAEETAYFIVDLK